MKLGILIDQISDLYSWQWMGHEDHDYIIYRDQLNQHSHYTTLGHHHQSMVKGLDYLITQGVDHIICPPTIELHYQSQYPQILPIFQQYITHNLHHSIVGKVGFVGSHTQCESINLYRGDITAQAGDTIPTPKQSNNRHFKSELPLWTSIDTHLNHWLTDHNPKHHICNTLIKQLLKPLKDAAVDSVIGLNWGYYACDPSRTHHCRSIKRHRSDALRKIYQSTTMPTSGSYIVSIHHTGTLRDLQANKKIWRLLAKGKSISVQTTQL